jgi:cytochrome P450
MTNWPYTFAQKTMSEGTAVASYTTNLLQAKQNLSSEEEHAIKWSAASLYGGGADTTVSVVYSLFLAMTLFPEIQRRAQEEIDNVIGNDRLPSLADRGTLPYTEAIILELLRWQPVIPLGVPHRCSEENEYNGYRIPKDSIVMPNQW